LLKNPWLIAVVWLWWLSGATQCSAAATNSVPPDALILRRFEWIPPFAAPRVISARFPRENPVISVERLLMADGVLWAALRPRKSSTLPPGQGRLWSYSDARGVLEPVRGSLEIHSVNALAADPRRLWLALNGGLASLEFKTSVVDAFGPAQGFVSTDVAGVGLIEGTVVALGRFGMLWGLPPGSSNFVRASEAAPSDNPRSPSPWSTFTTSGDWMAAISTSMIALRHRRGQQWISMRDELMNGSPRLSHPVFQCVAGDGEGGFWIGSDAGLHWVNPESNVVENRFAALSVSIHGGLGMRVAAGFQASPVAYEMARQRVIEQVRELMRDRARYARASAGLKDPINPVWPISRLPGGVRTICRDGPLLWIATTDGMNTNRSRILLMHQATRRSIGWFAVGAPVTSLAVDPKRLWLGLDITHNPGLSPLLVVDRLPLVSLPQTQWVKDAIPAVELGTKLAALPLKERAVLAFFGGDHKKVVELLAPEGEPAAETDAESLFLLAFTYDLVGLNQPDRLDHLVGLLRERYPDSLFAELAGGVRSARPAARAEGVEPEVVPAVVEPTPTPEPTLERPPEKLTETVTQPESVPPAVPAGVIPPEDSIRIEVVLKKRDLNRDGALNLVEFRLWLGPKSDFAAADTNRDGKVDGPEIRRVLHQEDARLGAP